jgi:hypothetical protein
MALRLNARADAYDQGVASFNGGPRPKGYEVRIALEMLDAHVDGIRKYNQSDTDATAERRIKNERERVRREMEQGANRLRRWEQAALRVADYHATMKRKYDRAARFPWLRVDPDPIKPEAPPPL